MNRTKFIETSGAAASAAVLGSVNTAFDEKPSGSKLPQGRKSKIKLGLYSISFGGIWYARPALSFEEFCKRAKDNGFDGVELDNKRPMGCPLDLDKRRSDEMVNAILKTGFEIPAVAANNGYFTYELCHPVLNEDHTRGDIKYVDDQVKLAREFLSGLIG